VRRLFWLGIGLALGALIFRKISQLAEKATPSGIARTVSGALSELSQAVRDFSADVRENMAEHEASLREAAELDGGHLGADAAGAGTDPARAPEA
jgi:hypothetical protein